MKRLLLMVMLLAVGVPAIAQDSPDPNAPKPTSDKTEDSTDEADASPDKTDEKEADNSVDPDEFSLKTDFIAYIKKLNPGLDPEGKHDLFNLQNPTGKERHEYTGNMAKLMLIYLQRLHYGSMVAKLFDQYARGQYANEAVFNCLYGLLLTQYPPGNSNWVDAQKYLNKAISLAGNKFAWAQYLLGEIELGKLRAGATSSASVALGYANDALTDSPNFLKAKLLKVRIYLAANPPAQPEAAKILDTLKNKIPANPDDYEEVLTHYGNAFTNEKLVELIDQQLVGGKLSNAHKERAYSVAAIALRQAGKLDEAIDYMRKVLDLSDPKANPEPAIRAHGFMAQCWGIKAINLRRSDPDLKEGDNQKDFDTFVEGARKNHEKAAMLEAEYQPIDYRGVEASAYVVFLYRGVARLEDALVWLEDYLAKTDLPATRRESLERVAARIRNILDPDESGLLEQIRDSIKSKDDGNLRAALRTTTQNVARGIHLKSDEAKDLMTELVNHHDREVTAMAALLLADTVTQREGQDRSAAAKVIVTRFEKEKETKTPEQSSLQQSLLQALRLVGDWKALAAAARHMKVLLDSADFRIRNELAFVVAVLHDKQFLGLLGADAPETLARRNLKKPAKVKDWMDELADALDKVAKKKAAEKDSGDSGNTPDD